MFNQNNNIMKTLRVLTVLFLVAVSSCNDPLSEGLNEASDIRIKELEVKDFETDAVSNPVEEEEKANQTEIGG